MRVAIFSNDDLTSNLIFAPLFDVTGIEITGLYIAASPRKGGSSMLKGALSLFRQMSARYWLFLVFTNGAYKLFDTLTLALSLSPASGPFSSLRRLAKLRGTKYRRVPEFSSPAVLSELRSDSVDLLVIRVGELLKPEVLEVPRYETWCVHSSLLPSFKGIAGEFHALRTPGAAIGSTVFKVSPKLDEGAPLAQVVIPRDENGSVFQHICANNGAAGELLAEMVRQLSECGSYASTLFNHELEGSYFSWPKSGEVSALHLHGKRLIGLGEAFLLAFAAIRLLGGVKLDRL